MKLKLILKNLNIGPRQRIAANKAREPAEFRGLFSALLEQALKPARGLLLPVPATRNRMRTGGLLSPLAPEGTNTGGTSRGRLKHFRNELMSPGIPLKGMWLSREALPDLKKILIEKGYSNAEVDSFLKKLVHGKPRHGVKITELLEKLSELKALSEKKASDPVLSDPVLEVSAASFSKASTKTDGTGWIEHFRNQLMLLGIPLKKMALSHEALPDLKKILIEEGYSDAEVDSFLKKLVHGKPRHGVKITELLEKLSELKALSEKKASDPVLSDPVLEVSAVPYLEASLSRLGVDLQEVNRAIEQARVQGGRLNLKGFVRNLKAILRGLPEGSKIEAEGKAAEDIKGMLVRVGIIDKAADIEGPISLERFVRILEQRVASLMPRTMPETQIENHVNRLLDNVLVEREQQRGKSSLKSLYANKLKVLPNGDLKDNQALKQIGEGWNENPPKSPFNKGGLLSTPNKGEFLSTPNKGEFLSIPNKGGLLSTPNKGGLLSTPLWKRGDRGDFKNEQILQEKVTSPYWVRESITERGPAPDAIIKQAARPVPIHVVNQVARQISLSLQRGENHIRLQLRPPQLGAIQIDMHMKDSVLKIGMATEHHSVKEFLISSIHELRDTLVQQGVKLERIDIQVNYNLGQSMAQARRGQNGFQRQRQEQRGGPGAVAGNSDVLETTMPRMIRPDALVDVIA
ncbi:MAG: flagellar hook-length control protein FliK [Desulfobacterales bacterium]|nr:flagellar hook-length control protein FliK [Desulfobacterales bacterium]